MKKFLSVLLVSLLLLGLVPAMASAEGDTLRFGTDAEPVGFDPHTISAIASLRIISQVYNTLIDLDADLNIIPELAESWEQPDDVTYIFHLRQDVTFHNGRKMTAEDVKYSFERILTPDSGMLGNSASYAKPIQAIEVIDEFTVKLTIDKINVAFLPSLSSNYCAVVCKEVVEANDGSLLRADGGTGPFTLGEWVPDNVVSIHRYDGYYDKDAVKLDTIEYYVMTDTAARVAAVRSGEVDLIVIDPDTVATVKDDANLKTLSYQSRSYSALCLNMNNEILANKGVRQAISLALNREEIIDMAYNGMAVVSGFVPASMGAWAVDVTTHPLYQQDIEKAKALLAEAGYPNGFEITLTVGLMDSLRNIGAVVQQQLAEIGIKVNVQNFENAQYIEKWNAHDFEIMACENGGGTDPNRAVAFFFKTVIKDETGKITGGVANIAEYSNARVDELCVLGAGTLDIEKRREYYTEAINIILDECPNVVIASPSVFYLTSPKVEGFAPSASAPYNFLGAYLVK